MATAAIGLSSCAYLIHGRNEQIQVTSDPPGAAVTMSDGQTGVTPFSVTVRREQNLVFHFSKTGYQAVDIADHSEIQVRYMASLIPGLLFPPALLLYGADSLTGAGQAHQTDEVKAQLQPLQPPEKNSTSAPPTVDPAKLTAETTTSH